MNAGVWMSSSVGSSAGCTPRAVATVLSSSRPYAWIRSHVKQHTIGPQRVLRPVVVDPGFRAPDQADAIAHATDRTAATVRSTRRLRLVVRQDERRAEHHEVAVRPAHMPGR